MNYKLTETYQSVKNFRKSQNNKRLITILSVLLIFIFGYLTAYWIHKKNNNTNNDYYSKLIEDSSNDERIRNILLSEINSDSIKTHLKYLSNVSHLAGTENGKLTAEYVYKTWKEQGLESIQLIDYDVYLDYPHETKFNNIEIEDPINKTKEIHEINEKVYDDDLDYSKISKPFLAYSPSGSVTSDKIFYLNYCDRQDFEHVLSINVILNDSIVMCRYGWSFRANKIYNAQYYGAKGVLLFDDPSRSAPKLAQAQIYPNGQFLPNDGTQRGTLNIKDGDPLTPLYPSNKYSFKLNEKDAKLPKIVSQVIGYGTAGMLFNLMESKIDSPNSWKGNLNTSYPIGGYLKLNKILTLNVYNEKKTKKIYNVIGVIKGSIEPDRYILIGNHRDAWTFGSVDPSSATSVLLEVSRSLSELIKKSNWSPRRSLIFLSWDAEEYGLIGSTEWIEEFTKKLAENSVVYINCDNAVHGNFSYEAKASPQLHKLLFDVTKNIKYDDKLSVYDRWIINKPNEDKTKPAINSNMGSGSDHANFLQRVGIPCIDQKFVRDKTDSLFKNITGSYPLYHTSYETFKLVEKFLDPNFFALSTLTKIISELSRILSDSLILPFDIENYSIEINKQLRNFKKDYKLKLENFNISLNNLDECVENFNKNVKKFKENLDNLDKNQYHMIRYFNDQMKNLEKSFLDFQYINTGSMHTLYAPSSFNKYLGYSFPGLVKSIDETGKEPDINLIEFNLAILINSIQSASHILKDPIDFSRF